MDSVKHTFVSTIEEMEPGKLMDESGNSLQGLTPERPTNMGFNEMYDMGGPPPRF